MPPRAPGGPRRRLPLFGEDDRDLALDLVVTSTGDGQSWDGMVFRPRGGDPRRRRLGVIVVHGSVGNYLTGVPRRVSFGLGDGGLHRAVGQHADGELRRHLRRRADAQDARSTSTRPSRVMRRRGFTRIVLLGFSMGATMVTHYQALRRPPDVVGICTLAHPASLPAAMRLRWDHFGADPGYEEVA